MKFILLILLGVLPAFVSFGESSVHWDMVNVNAGDLQADAHLIEMPNGSWFLIDCGDPYTSLVSFLQKKKVREIEKVLISHLHKDHYGGLISILESGIRIKEVYLTVPSRKVCDLEKPWGCNWEEIQVLLKTLKEKSVPVRSYAKGGTLFEQGGVRLRSLYAYDGENTPVGVTDVNDMSAILLLENGKSRVLFTGDLNSRLGEYLAKNAPDLHADILKIPHHGAESLAPDSFFAAVHPIAALVPAPRSLWKNARTERVRKYLAKNKILTYVSGIDGNLSVNLTEEGFTITAQNRKHPLLWMSSLYKR